MSDHVKVEILKSLRADGRFRSLPPGARDQLVACVIAFGVGTDGRFWAKNKTVVEDLVGTSERSVRENFRKAEATGILTRIDWYHDTRGGQVSNSFELDRALVPLHLVAEPASEPLAREEADFRASLSKGEEADFRPNTEERLCTPLKKGRAADAAPHISDEERDENLAVVRGLAKRYTERR